MAIETICQKCGCKLRVAEAFAGRQARCPRCKNVYTVPGSAVSVVDQWRLRTEDGSVYGPVSKAELDSWVREGRVTKQSYLQREGTPEWRQAVDYYPGLAGPTRSDQPSSERSTNPFADPVPISRVGLPNRGTRRYRRPHRGGTILALGIAGLVCCQILSPFAWIMGQSDLRAMNEGRMQPGGRNLTQVGTVLGIVGTVILILWAAGHFLAAFGSTL